MWVVAWVCSSLVQRTGGTWDQAARALIWSWLLTLLDSALLGVCRDGYTDLRGRFDYVTLTSTADMSSVVRYSLLVASRDKGAVMLQASPPPK